MPSGDLGGVLKYRTFCKVELFSFYFLFLFDTSTKVHYLVYYLSFCKYLLFIRLSSRHERSSEADGIQMAQGKTGKKQILKLKCLDGLTT